jgi:hypothetical protein
LVTTWQQLMRIVLLLDLQNVTVAINFNHCLARCSINPDTPARD